MLHNQAELTSANRVVVKVGSSSITGVNEAKIDKLVDALAAAHKRGQQVVVVTSGAIATGLPLLGLEVKPGDLPTSQALASVGQGRLISRYQQSLERLLELRVIPIVNENDTVATTEIRFGDNDRLGALVSVLIEADALIMLSDVDALYNMPPTKPGAKRIERIEYGQDISDIEIGGSGTSVGTGGAVTKVSAAKIANDAGVAVLLTSSDLVNEALSGVDIGTWFAAKG
jgi:glutamate 5-kinase